jgi:molybdopterin-guanine dinucleotide biosynthesis protein A
MNQAAVILTGGKSSRMGTDKALLRIGEKTFTEEIYKRLKRNFDHIVLSVSAINKYAELNLEAEQVEDVYQSIGPMGGIYSVLKNTGYDQIFVVGVDNPFISEKAVKGIMELGQGYDICLIEKENGRLQPLFAMYGKSCIPYMEQMIEKKVYKMTELCALVKTRTVSVQELEEKSVEKLEETLINLNTMEDYLKYCKEYKHKEAP